jgi:glycosyltransferase involved in cell wall biosynthesis
MPAAMAPEPFSVLLPVWAGDDARFLDRAFASVTSEQLRPPDEVVIVQDGPVPDDLGRCIKELVDAATVPVNLIQLPVNRGLGWALEAGLDAVEHDIVARMDADDISVPSRFERQIPLVEQGFDIVGSALAEMGSDEGDLGGVRCPPAEHADILRFARFHSPFNHPTVVLRRRAVAAAGGYEHLPSLEDYWLWVRMLASGARSANIQDPLLLYRVGAGAYQRRGGLRLAWREVDLQLRMRRLGFTTRAEFARNVAVRATWRLVPVGLRRPLYGLAFRRSGGQLPIADRK